MNITFLLPTFRHCFAGRAYVMLTCKPVVVTLFLFVDTGAFNSTHSLTHCPFRIHGSPCYARVGRWKATSFRGEVS